MSCSGDVGLAIGKWSAAALLCLFLATVCPVALGQDANLANQAQSRFSFSFGEMFTFFFLMLGPLKIIGPFVSMTRKSDAKFARRLALRAFLYSCIALLFAAVLGENSLRNYHISVPVLAIAAGIILFLVALQTVMHQYDPHAAAVPKEYDADLHLAFFPLSFPTIVTPYGVAAVIVCMALTPEYLVKAAIYAALLGLMVLNLIGMLLAKPILRYLGMPMLLLGTVLGVIQVALGLAIIFRGLRGLGFGTG